jgi:hypothetical protein
MMIYILLALIASDLINADFFPFRKSRIYSTSANTNDFSPRQTFAKQFGIYAIDRLFDQGLQENEQFGRTVINEMSAEFFPALINSYAQKREWRKVKFMLSNGVDPFLLQYSIKRASMRNYLNNDLVQLRELVGKRVNIDAIINTQLDVDELNEILRPYARELARSRWQILLPLPQNPGKYITNGLMSWSFNSAHMEVFKFLLARGAYVDMWIDHVLKGASKKGHIELVRLLLADGADIHLWGDGALREASGNGHAELVRLLLSHGADVHAWSDEALRLASLNYKVDCSELLLDNGTDLYANSDFALNLQCASLNRHVEVVKILLAHGASPRAEMVEEARFAGHHETANLLQAKLDQLQG